MCRYGNHANLDSIHVDTLVVIATARWCVGAPTLLMGLATVG